mmetsp:Transcript_5853/g.18861  ORF Transcript_5853/g.18861 Transcript_5853/m.18861 type:complete len:88 (+) Transcript_5853:1078-1341(+)
MNASYHAAFFQSMPPKLLSNMYGIRCNVEQIILVYHSNGFIDNTNCNIERRGCIPLFDSNGAHIRVRNVHIKTFATIYDNVLCRNDR